MNRSLWTPAPHAFLLGGLSALAAAPASRPKPNIVLIFADDMGWRDTGFNGSDYYETPNLDRLSSQGMTFTQAYACGANCAPSRACLLSGQYTPRHGVYAVGNTKRGPEKLMRMIPVPTTPASTRRMSRWRRRSRSRATPNDPDARITKMKDGRTHLAHKA